MNMYSEYTRLLLEASEDGGGATVAAVVLGVLAANAEVPVVTETTVDTVALHALEVVTEGGVNGRGNELEGLAGVAVLLAVKEPGGDVEVLGVLDDGLDRLEVSLGELTSAKQKQGKNERGMCG
jgi:hypothetical protein